MYKGTLRYNLDPSEKVSDEKMLELLKAAGLDVIILKAKEKTLKEKAELLNLTEEELAERKKAEETEGDSLLNFNVGEAGDGLSSGEKSLICICRAILRENKIIILDEATANIDIESEQKIQELI